SMEETTLEADRGRRLAISGRDRLGAWLYTGAPGRLASFSIDLALSLAALGLWSARRAWRRLRGGHPAA
ncbi:MAG TPA: hypothetical protein VLB79_01030, partial [Solirubrobacterales bacterium]|nr:hypothetical protein [Solirubrobacterales bacterium]